jgi:hypothetical protein
LIARRALQPGGARRQTHGAESPGFLFRPRDHRVQHVDCRSNVASQSSSQVVGLRSAEHVPLERVCDALATGITANGAEHGRHSRNPTARYAYEADGHARSDSAGLACGHPAKAVDADVETAQLHRLLIERMRKFTGPCGPFLRRFLEMDSQRVKRCLEVALSPLGQGALSQVTEQRAL